MSHIKGIPRNAKIPPLQRLLAHHVVDLFTECWVWTGYINNTGYGVTGTGSRTIGDRKSILAHRLSYKCFIGDIPPEMGVLHTCDNPPCINPAHLFLGTDADNTRDKMDKGRHNTLRGSQIGTSILTESDVQNIKTLINTMNDCQIARVLGISSNTVWSIRHGRSWRHVK